MDYENMLSSLNRIIQYLLSDWHIKFILGQVLDLTGLQSSNLPSHTHHTRISADICDICSAVALQLPPYSPEVQPFLHLHLLQVDLGREEIRICEFSYFLLQPMKRQMCSK